MEDPHFWDNPEEATKKQRLLGNLKNDVETYNKLVSDHDDIRDMIEMADEEPDPSIVPEVEEMFEDFKNRFETLRMKTLLSGLSHVLEVGGVPRLPGRGSRQP